MKPLATVLGVGSHVLNVPLAGSLCQPAERGHAACCASLFITAQLRQPRQFFHDGRRVRQIPGKTSMPFNLENDSAVTVIFPCYLAYSVGVAG